MSERVQLDHQDRVLILFLHKRGNKYLFYSSKEPEVECQISDDKIYS